MNPVRLIAMDMDGTLLLSDHKTLPPENIEAIRRADAAGIRMCICTGRMLEDASDFIHRLHLPCMIIAANGARASDGPLPEGRVLFRRSFSAGDAHRAIDALLPFQLMINGFEDGLTTTVQDETGRIYHLVERGLIPARYGMDALRAAADRGVMKIFAVGHGSGIGDDEDPRIALAREAVHAALPRAQITSSAPGNLEVMPEGVSKGAALAAVAAQLGLTRNNVMAIGDAANDLSMLSYAAFSVAMGNAAPDILEACRFQTSTNDEFGVARIIDRVLNGSLFA